MSAISKQEVFERRQSFIDYIKENMDDKGYLNLRCSLVCQKLGIDSQTVHRYLEHFSNGGCLEFTHLQKGSWLVHYNGNTRPASENSIYIPIAKPRRICPKCKVEAANDGARFCWKCGSSLLSEKEQVKEEYHNILGFICRVVKNPMDTKKIMEVLSKVEKIAFGEEKGE